MVKQAVSNQYPCRSILQGKRPLRVPRSIVSLVPLVAAALISFLSLPAGAEIPYDEMVDLGTLRDNNTGASEAHALSTDGSVAAGHADDDNGDYRAFRWAQDGGMVDLGTLKADNRGDSFAFALSADGSVVAGYADNDAGEFRAFRWTQDGGMIGLGTLKADSSGFSYAYALSADGSVVAGGAQNDANKNRAFRWTEADGMVDLGTLKADNSGSSTVRALSADGSVAAGLAQSDTESYRAFRWTEADGMADLGTLKTDNTGNSIAYALSDDGSVAAGYAENDAGGSRAFRWTQDGGMADLGTLRDDNAGDSYGYALSADGSVAAGSAQNDNGEFRAFRWTTQGGGMIDLGTLKDDNTDMSEAHALSADGGVIAGAAQNDNGEYRAFIYRSIMQDYDNLLASFPLLANDADVATAAQQWTLASILDQTCFAGRKGGVCLSLGGRFSYTGSDDAHDLGSRTGATGLLSLGYGVNEAFTFGATAALGLTELDHNGFDMQTGYGFGVWGEYSEEGMSRTGWQIGLAAGWGTQDTDITRGMGLDNVELVDGSSDLSTLSGRLSLGYGFRNPDDWVLTPRASVTAYRTRLDAYGETEGDFTADYDRMEVTATTATVEVTAVKRIGNGSRLSLGAGLDYDLDADRARLEGTSTVPGLETFSVGSSLDRNDLRPFVAAAYSFRVTDSSWFTTSAGVQSPVFGSSPRIDAGLRYCVRF